MPTTTTMALSSPLNPSTLSVTSQVSTMKDETVGAVSPQLTQQHDATTSETAQLLSPNGDDANDIIKATVNGNNMKNGAVAGLLTADHGSPKMTLHSPITIGTSLSSEIDVDLNIKSGIGGGVGSDMSCLNVVTSSSPTSLSSGANNNHFLNGTNGHLLMAQSGASLNFQASNSPDSPWSIGEVESSGFVNYSSTNNGQMHKRPIMSQQPHHGLSPNSSSIGRNNASQQQYIHYNKNNGNSSNNYSAAWSNSGPNSPWQQQQQMQHQQQQQQQQQQHLLHQSSSQANWNRGRSVPNLNPLSPNVPPHQRKHQTPTQYSMPPSASSSQGLSPNPNSPSKYRRSTSYPGKNQNNMHGYQMDAVGGIIEDQPYMSYQDRNMDMRSLEHCLNDITNTAGVQSDLKGFLNCNSTTLQSLAQLQGKLDFHEFIPGKPFYQNEDQTEESGGFLDGNNLQIGSPARSSPHSQGSDNGERFSRKVFVGGLPPDIDEDEITSSFRRYGPLIVDWPHKAESKSYFPPKGYAFLLFQDECSVQNLIENCIIEDDKLYICVSSPTIKNKPVQIRPWRLSDADFVLDASMSLDPRKTVFVGGVPRPLKALELAMIMDRLYGGVCYAGIDTDPELKYPKGAGRVAFSNQQSYIAAISARFVQLQHGDIDKRVEVKPYVLDDQMCDECGGQRCSGKFAPFFCANVTCLQYYCEHCWATIHSRPGREYHKPLVKEGADRPRAVPFRWC